VDQLRSFDHRVRPSTRARRGQPAVYHIIPLAFRLNLAVSCVFYLWVSVQDPIRCDAYTVTVAVLCFAWKCDLWLLEIWVREIRDWLGDRVGRLARDLTSP
jgi:hypothetical protein